MRIMKTARAVARPRRFSTVAVLVGLVFFISFCFIFSFFIWAPRRGSGGDASKRRNHTFSSQRRATLAHLAAPSGFPVQCFLPSHMPGGTIRAYAAYAIRPYVRAYRIRPPAKNISPSIPGATLVGIQSPFRGEAPDPLVCHHSRAAISAPLPIPTELLPLPGHPATSAMSATR